MTESLRHLLRDHWNALAAKPIGSARSMRVATLPVKGVGGPICAALDLNNGRHLLIPIGVNESAPSEPQSNLQWRERGLEEDGRYVRFADLSCDRSDLVDVFNGLCGDVLVAIEGTPSRPLKAARAVVARWRALFATAPASLGAGQLAGLFGELLVLLRLLQSHGGATQLWTGPSGHRHDFTAAGRSIEVKTSQATEGRRIRVHGLDQLEQPAGAGLDLVWFRVERHATGRSVAELVDELLSAADDEHGVLTRLAMAGYLVADQRQYAEIRFRVVEECWFEVDEAFPRIVPASFVGLVPPVTDVHYTIDLLIEPTSRLLEAQVKAHIAEMTGDMA